ncbi:uncharacterized protein J3R85_007382 [Psidium guajava]|nr:uncharacterized protein J3R85_007382 [Psidium guajava]
MRYNGKILCFRLQFCFKFGRKERTTVEMVYLLMISTVYGIPSPKKRGKVFWHVR